MHDHPSLSMKDDQAIADQKLAMKWSFVLGLLMLGIKTYAFAITNSAAIFSDAAESVVHVVAVGFAAYSLWVSLRPINRNFPFGYEKISYFSAGVEGALITIASGVILYEAAMRLISGSMLTRLSQGTGLIVMASIINGILGLYLIRQGKRHHSLILIANGQHVLTDCYTSVGVVIGLGLALVTGWQPIDPLVAILVGSNILWTGAQLMRRSIGGLMDVADPEHHETILKQLKTMTNEQGIDFHNLRSRNSGSTVWIECHLIFDTKISLREAHRIATKIEEAIIEALPVDARMITHLETADDHEDIHHHHHVEEL